MRELNKQREFRVGLLSRPGQKNLSLTGAFWQTNTRGWGQAPLVIRIAHFCVMLYKYIHEPHRGSKKDASTSRVVCVCVCVCVYVCVFVCVCMCVCVCANMRVRI
jgi:hypothetical protein